MDDPKNTKKRKKIAGLVLSLVLVAALGALLFLSLPGRVEAPSRLKDYYREKGVQETGSVNLVSSIYLGYRAMDTLGETMVLLITVTGVIAIMGRKE
jgi:multisubunit Na+/H+ antiporter MnhB subunit